MTGIGEDEPTDHLEGYGREGEARKRAWARTIEDMEEIAKARRERGWEAVAIPAVHTSPVDRDAGEDGRFGLAHIIANNHEERFSETFRGRDFPRYEAYRNEVGQYVFLVTELLDPDTETAILLAGHYDLQRARGMIRSALDSGVIYTYVKLLDGTILGSVRHESVEPMLPETGRSSTTSSGTNPTDENEG